MRRFSACLDSGTKCHDQVLFEGNVKSETVGTLRLSTL